MRLRLPRDAVLIIPINHKGIIDVSSIKPQRGNSIKKRNVGEQNLLIRSFLFSEHEIIVLRLKSEVHVCTIMD